MPAATETATYAYTAFKTEVVRFPDQRVKSQIKPVSINVPELSEVTDFGICLQSFKMRYPNTSREVRNLGIEISNERVSNENTITFDATLTFNNGDDRRMSGEVSFLAIAQGLPA